MSRWHRQRLSSRAWGRVRRVVFARDGYSCVNCGKGRGSLECDHIKPLHLGGAAYDLANLQTLCRTCHIRKSRRRRPSRAWESMVQELQNGGSPRGRATLE